MSITWTISQNGGPQLALSALNIVDPKVIFRSFDSDELQFSIPSSNICAKAQFGYGDQVILYRVDGAVATPYFIGTIRRHQSKASGKDEIDIFTAFNAWWDLEHLTYQQTRYFQAPDFLGLSSELSPHVTLGQDLFLGSSLCGFTETALPVTNASQIYNCLFFAYQQGVSINPLVTMTGVMIPYEEAYGITVAGAIRRMAAWVPSSFSQFDYTLNPPKLIVGQRSGQATQSIDLAALGTVKSFSIEPRYDLQLRGVVFNYNGTRINPTDGQKYQFPQQEMAGVFTGINVLVQDLNLTLDFTDITTYYLIGLAASYYAEYGGLFWDGSLELVEQECDANFRPGSVLNFINCRSQWASANLLVQSVSQDLFMGTTAVQFGVPTALGVQDFVSLGRAIRRSFDSVVTLVPSGPTQTDTTGITFTQSGNILTASSAIFTSSDVCRSVSLADGFTCLIVAYIDSTHVQCAGYHNTTGPTKGTVWHNGSSDTLDPSAASRVGGTAPSHQVVNAALSPSGVKYAGASNGVPTYKAVAVNLCDGSTLNVLTQ